MIRSATRVRQLRAEFKPIHLSLLDQRSRESRFLRRVRDELSTQLGGNPTATQRTLIERAAQIQLRLALMDKRFVDNGGVMSDHDTRTYLAWSNSLSRLMAQLGLDAAPPPPLTHAETMAALSAAAARGQREHLDEEE